MTRSDEGTGIQDPDIKRLSEPFCTKKVMGRSGTEPGMAVVCGTVKDHHGYINTQNDGGKGSTFTLYFPVTRERQSTEQIPVTFSEYLEKENQSLL